MTLDPLEAKIERPAAGRALPIDWIVGAVVVAALVLAPFVATEYYLSAIITQAL